MKSSQIELPVYAFDLPVYPVSVPAIILCALLLKHLQLLGLEGKLLLQLLGYLPDFLLLGRHFGFPLFFKVFLQSVVVIIVRVDVFFVLMLSFMSIKSVRLSLKGSQKSFLMTI
jgi:hypothetical protein